MKSLYGLPLLLAGSLAGLPSALAQGHEHAAGDVQELGQVAFATSCMAEVQEDFNRAVAMLHSFWYQAAEKAFAEVARRDRHCAMAHWGVAMSRFHQLWEKPGPEDVAEGQRALAAARAAGPGSNRERDYIEALGRFYEDARNTDHVSRMAAYEEAMGELAQRYPDDSEAAVFHALAMLGTAYSSPPDETYASQRKAGAILKEIFARQPNHPGIAHYIIHSHDYPALAEEALEAARRYAMIAPAAPHALHMPSHIFTRLGLWQESIASNSAAAAAAHKDHWTGEELHTTDYLTYAYLQGAQDGKAREILDGLPRLEEDLKPGASNYFAGVYAMAAIPARYAVERRQWKEAAALAVPGVRPGGSPCWAGATLHLARGLGATRTGELDAARHSIEELERCREILLEAGEGLWANQVEVARRGVTASLALAEGNHESALATMRSAADLEDSTDKHPVTPGAIVPARELLAEMLLEMNRPDEALTEFEAALRDAPNRFRSLYGAARAAHLAGDDERSGRYYSQLLEISMLADTERAELLEAENFLKQALTSDPSPSIPESRRGARPPAEPRERTTSSLPRSSAGTYRTQAASA